MIRSSLPLLIAVLSLAACSPPAAGPVKPDKSWQPSLLSPVQRRLEPLTARWLVGYWDVDKKCATGGGTSLHPDGTYWMGGAFGRWSFGGNALRIDELHPPDEFYMIVRLGDPGPSRVRKVGPDSIFVQWAGSPGFTFHRCDPR